METGMKWLRVLPAVAGTLVAAGLLIILLWPPVTLDWAKFVGLLVIAPFTFAIVFILRYAIGATTESPLHLDGNNGVRSRLAPLVIGIGTAGILVVAIAVLVGISAGRTTPVEPEVYLGVFSTVVPVFATWVGAVIAFYFTNESFRQAAQSTGALVGDRSNDEPITAPTRMIPFEKITGLTLGATIDNVQVPAKVEEVPMDLVKNLFGQTVSRVIIFDAQKRPQKILRAKLVPTDKPVAVIGDYLAHDQNGADAVNFQTIPEKATVGEARAMLKVFNVADLFVTPLGSREEGIKGWVPDDRLA